MKIYYKNKYWKLNEDYNINKILYFLIDRTNIIGYYNEYVWTNKKGGWNRNYDLPSYISDKYIVWIINNKKHRKNKPAIIYSDGSKLYFTNGKYIKTEFTT